MGGQYIASNILTSLNPIVWGDKCCLKNNDPPPPPPKKKKKKNQQKESKIEGTHCLALHRTFMRIGVEGWVPISSLKLSSSGLC